MIKIKRVYDPPSEDDGKRILVYRLTFSFTRRGVREDEGARLESV